MVNLRDWPWIPPTLIQVDCVAGCYVQVSLVIYTPGMSNILNEKNVVITTWGRVVSNTDSIITNYSTVAQ